jgi:hypothetical protein
MHPLTMPPTSYLVDQGINTHMIREGFKFVTLTLHGWVLPFYMYIFIPVHVSLGLEIFSKTIQTSSGAHPASYLMGARVLSWRQSFHFEADHSSPSSTHIKNQWSYTSSSPIWLRGMNRENFAFFIRHSVQHKVKKLISRQKKVLACHKSTGNSYLLFETSWFESHMHLNT